jgi:hypothetical protein
MLPATVALVSSAFSGTQRGIAISTPPSTPDSATILSRRHTGSIPKLFDPLLSPYLDAARTASAWGYAAAFLGVTVLGIAGVILAFTISRSKNREVSDLG